MDAEEDLIGDTEILDFDPEDFQCLDDPDFIDLRRQEQILRGQSGSVSSLSAGSNNSSLKQILLGSNNFSRANSSDLSNDAAQRVILHVDLDCFFVQVEQHLNPSLRGQPIAVHQHEDVIAISYEARALGVKKHMTPSEAKAVHPGIILVPMQVGHGSKVSYKIYREESQKIIDCAKSFFHDSGPPVLEKGSIDEFFLDVSSEVSRRISNMNSLATTVIVSSSLHNDSPSQSINPTCASGITRTNQPGIPWPPGLNYNSAPPVLLPEEEPLRVGAFIAYELREHILSKLGYHTSAGIANNKLLAKIGSALNKPKNQTTILQRHVASLMLDLPLRKLPRLLTRAGHRAVLDLENRFKVATCGDISRDETTHSRLDLIARYGEISGDWIYTRCRGQDDDPVQQKGPQKSLACSMSLTPFGPKEDQLRKILDMICAELVERLQKDFRENNRKPQQIMLLYRNLNAKEKHCHAPITLVTRSSLSKGFDPDEGNYAKDAIVAAALEMFKQSIKETIEPWNLRWISVCFGQFSSMPDAKTAITTFFSSKPQSSKLGSAANRKTTPSAPILIDDFDNHYQEQPRSASATLSSGMHEPELSDDDCVIVEAPLIPPPSKRQKRT